MLEKLFGGFLCGCRGNIQRGEDSSQSNKYIRKGKEIKWEKKTLEIVRMKGEEEEQDSGERFLKEIGEPLKNGSG